MDKDPQVNPYSPPESEFNANLPANAHGIELAERSTRLAAATLDGLLATVPFTPGLFLGIYAVVRYELDPGDLADVGKTEVHAMVGRDEALALFGGLLVLGLLVFLGIAIYQWILISRTGQSLGKRWTGIRIERMDGSRVTFGTGVVLRNWIPKLMSAIPYLGWIFQLVDCLYIYRQDHRCLHDHIAGTRVVRHYR
jgi:uncharacterized RDD family membrane protein YckC